MEIKCYICNRNLSKAKTLSTHPIVIGLASGKETAICTHCEKKIYLFEWEDTKKHPVRVANYIETLKKEQNEKQT